MADIIEDYDYIAQRLRELEKEQEPQKPAPIVNDANPPDYTAYDPWGLDSGYC